MGEIATTVLTALASTAVLTLVAVYGCVGLLYWKRPLWLLELYQEAGTALKLPKVLESLLKQFPFIDRIAHSPRVLDAWVGEHVEKARANFAALPTVRERTIHLLLPVEVERDQGIPTLVSELTATDLRPVFSRNRGCVLVRGEGGVGKTSWACQLGWWALEERPERRLASHAMLPVIVEEEVSSPEPGIAPLLNHIRGKLDALTGSSRQISERLLDALLRTGRILVVMDHFSELSGPTRDRLRPGEPGFPIAALVVTARTDEALGNQPRWVLRPCRIEADKLYKFLTDYLRAKGGEGAFPTQVEFFDACGRLSNLVGKRDITPLLARMFADLMIDANAAKTWDDLPRTVPNLIAEYVVLLNRSIAEGRQPDEQVQADLRRIAWECMRETLRPGEAERSSVLKVLEGNDPAGRLHYLEQRLQLVRAVAHSPKVRLTLDPVAEYMAARELVARNGGRSASWERFFQQVTDTPGAPLGVRGFLTAVRDVCRNRGAKSEVLEGVAQRIRDLLGDNTPEVDEEIQELINALKSRSPYLRQVALQSLAQDHRSAAATAIPAIVACLLDDNTRHDAIDAIKSIGPAAAGAVPHLIAILERSLVWTERCSAANALGAIGPAAKAAIPVLCKALEHEEMPVRRDAAEALGLIDPTAPETVQALRRVVTESGQVGLPAAFALAKAGDEVPSRLEALLRALEGDDLGHCQRATELLGQLGPIAASAVPQLSETLERDKSTFTKDSRRFVTIGAVRRSAALALVQIDGVTSQNAPHLIQSFGDSDETTREKAVELVIAIGGSVVPELCRGLTDAHAWVRFLSAHALGELAEQTQEKAVVIEALVKALSSDTDDDVCGNAAEALGKFGKSAVAAVPTLEAALKHKSENVQKEAATALVKIRD